MTTHDTSTPVWLLDFDGVVNAISRSGGKSIWPQWYQASVPHPLLKGQGLPLLWSPDVIAVIREAVDAGVDVQWLTTWREHTRMLPGVIDGLPTLPWLDESILSDAVREGLDPNQRMAAGPWKLAVAQAYVPDTAELLWTDDSYWLAAWSPGVKDWAHSRSATMTFIQPTETHGLTQRNVRSIREWITAHTG